ncbi:hypothetical protein BHM03_00041583 [Ensete ventricosum]|uniref:Uncharacterized protein n=1 Tax=Ensete ventricosum TaxID=4639 RepID=A0A445MKI9_ENSVE|nr:hypothetical protein BHM03_00041583 [Ensete ventricosum]
MACRQSSPVITMVPMKKGLLLLFIIVAGLHQGSSNTYPADADGRTHLPAGGTTATPAVNLESHGKERLLDCGFSGSIPNEIGSLSRLEIL